MPITEVDKIWMDGELVDWRDAKIHVLSPRAALRQRAYSRASAPTRPLAGPAVWHLDEHLERLFRSAKLYHMDIPYSVEAIRRRDEGGDPRERPGRLLRPTARDARLRRDGREPAERAGERDHRGLAVGRVPRRGRPRAGRPDQDPSWRRNDQNSLPPRREGDRPVHQLACSRRSRSLKAGYDEAIMLNEQGFITDGSGENVFVVHGRRDHDAADAGRLPRRHHARHP